MAFRRTRRQSMAIMLAAVALASGVGSSCAKGEPEPPERSIADSPSGPPSSVEPSLGAAEQQALAAYNGYIRSWALASQAADPDDPNLPRYVADPLLSLTRHNIRKLKDIGAVQVGAQQATVLDSEADLAAEPPHVTVRACLDYSDLKLVYESNGSPVPDSEIKRKKVATVAIVTRHSAGQWLVTESKGSDPC